jgi:hypothetical protein
MPRGDHRAFWLKEKGSLLLARVLGVPPVAMAATLATGQQSHSSGSNDSHSHDGQQSPSGQYIEYGMLAQVFAGQRRRQQEPDREQTVRMRVSVSSHTSSVYRFFALLVMEARLASNYSADLHASHERTRPRGDEDAHIEQICFTGPGGLNGSTGTNGLDDQRSQSPQSLLWWETGRACLQRFISGQRPLAICPDGIGEYALHGRRIHFWLEWDRATLNTRDWRHKLQLYAHYAHATAWRDASPPVPPLVLLITTDYAQEARIRSLVSELGAWGWFSPATPLMMRITTLSRLLAAGSCLAPIWFPLLPAAQPAAPSAATDPDLPSMNPMIGSADVSRLSRAPLARTLVSSAYDSDEADYDEADSDEAKRVPGILPVRLSQHGPSASGLLLSPFDRTGLQ